MNTYNGPIKEVKLVEKVKLTKEQAELIEMYKNNPVIFGPIGYFAEEIKKYDNAVYRELAKLSVDDFAKAYYIGYEIEPEQPKFQPGDKVVRVDGGTFTDGKHILKILGGVENCSDFPDYRHATPEEIYWLETLGREKVGDFRVGDVFVSEDGGFRVRNRGINSIEKAKSWYEGDGYFIGIYPSDSFRPFKKEPSNER